MAYSPLFRTLANHNIAYWKLRWSEWWSTAYAELFTDVIQYVEPERQLFPSVTIPYIAWKDHAHMRQFQCMLEEMTTWPVYKGSGNYFLILQPAEFV